MNQFNYAYCLGHQPSVGVSEILSNHKVEEYSISKDGKSLYTNTLLDIQKLGSVRYVLKYINTTKTIGDAINFICDEISSSEDKKRRIGVIVPLQFHSQVLQDLKKVVKHVSLVKSEFDYTFGHWKSTKNWYVINKHGNSVLLWKVHAVFDQQFWAEMDVKLPYSDMRRGIINLKLARTLGTFSTKDICWDPFCGLGRVVAANLDKKKEWYASDIDNLTKEVIRNVVQAKFLFASRKHTEIGDTFKSVFVCNAEHFNNIEKTVDLARTSIVTEGFLGKNFNSQPTLKDINEQMRNLSKMWSNVLQQAQVYRIPELVFCLPYYHLPKNIDKLAEHLLYEIDGNDIIPQFQNELANKFGYVADKIDNTKSFLLYSRPNSFVGHCIVKLTLI